jgi:hypothetical protein
MKAMLLAVVFWQFVHADAGGPRAEPQYFRYERAIKAGRAAPGPECVVLDAAVFEHASSEALSDLRLYAEPSGVETPFAFSVSGTQSDEEDAATVVNLGEAGGDITFDARMPERPYSSVRLNLAAKDYVGTVRVSGVAPKATPVQLGTFTIFDLTAQHLAHSTELPMQESTFPVLHFTMHLAAAPGASGGFAPTIVTGVSVPPSREAETLYKDVAMSSAFTQQGRDSVASVTVMPHVAIDRVVIRPRAEFGGNFARQVSVTATPSSGDAASAESVAGEISHVTLNGREAGDDPGFAVDRASFAVETPLVTNLKSAASIRIAVHNGDDRALPLAPAELQMRQRKICFDEEGNNTSFALMYGDAAVAAPVYDYARLFQASAVSGEAALGPEIGNPGYRQRPDARPFTEHHPGLLWVVLLAVVAVLGSLALRGVRGERSS